MTLTLYPAMDLIDGACVRLAQGDFARKTVYSNDPVAVAVSFAAAGATHLHVVDLDGARDPDRRQTALIARIAAATALRVQVGGGVRSAADVEALLALGVERVVIGSLAVTAPTATAAIIRAQGAERITLALDVVLDRSGTPRVAIHGWRKDSGLALDEVLTPYLEQGVSRVLCTDIGRDGMMTGPNLALYRALVAACPGVAILASGGVRSSTDLRELAAAQVPGAIVGRALYDGTMVLADALAELRAC